MHKQAKIGLLLALFSFVFFFSPAISNAVFDLSITQSEGGFDLRFDRINPDDFKIAREMTVQINSDIGKPYRVFQQLTQPLISGDGKLLDPAQFQSYPLPNSNSTGTLVYRQELPVSTEQELVYASDDAGDADSFQLVYTITPKPTQIPGSYRGRLALILIPVETSTQTQYVTNVQIFVDFSGGNAAVAEIASANGTDILTIDSKDLQLTKTGVEGTWPQVRIKIHNPVGSAYSIYQSLDTPELTSNEGYSFDLSRVNVVVQGGEKGAKAQTTTLKDARQPQLLYTSDPKGSPDEIAVVLSPDRSFRLEKAGFYRGRLSFWIQTDQTQTQVQKAPFNIEFNVAPLFDIRVYSQETEGVSLKFGEVNYKSGPVASETDIYVESNLGKPYKVIQKVSSPMVNEAGQKVPAEDFIMKVGEAEVQEEPAFSIKDFAPVTEGEHVIFSSGPKGLSAKMKVSYTLKTGPDSPAGNYSTRIGYSLVLD